MNRKTKSFMTLGMTAVIAAAIPMGANAAEVKTADSKASFTTVAATLSAAPNVSNVSFQMLPGTSLTSTISSLPATAIRIGADRNALLSFLGMDEATYTEELKSGKTLLQIAEAHGITKEQLIQFETNAFTASIDQAVADGKLTEEQAAKMKEGFAGSLEQRLEGKGLFVTKSIRLDSESLEEAVTSGKLTQEQADRMKEMQAQPGTLTIAEGGSIAFAAEGSAGFALDAVDLQGGPGSAIAGKAIRIGGNIKELLAFLGIDEAAYLEQLKSGKSLLEIAEANGKTKDELLAFESNAFAADMEQAVKDGRLTEEQAAKMKADYAEHAEQRIEAIRVFFQSATAALLPSAGFALDAVDLLGGPGSAIAGKTIRIGGDIKELLAFLGIDEAAYLEQLKSGKSLLEIAEANGKTKDELLAFESNAFAADMEQAVEDGRLTEEQAAKMKADYAEHAEQRIEGKRVFFQSATAAPLPAGVMTFSQTKFEPVSVPLIW